MAKIAPYVFWQELDNNGDPLAGGKVETFEAGTSTNKVTFTSEDESASNTNPVILDSAGRANIWLDSGSYKFVIKDSDDVIIRTVDDITAGASDVYASGVTDISVNTNITSSFINLVVNCTGTITLSLLDVSTAEEGFIFVVRNSGSGVITLDPDGAELIDGAATKDIQPDGSLNVNCTGTAWITTNENYGTTNVKTMTFSGDNTHSGNNTHTGTNSYSGVSTHTALVKLAKGADVASATALPVLTDGNYFDVTGTDAITSIDTLGIGTVIKLQFDDILTLTHDATDLILPGGDDITTAAGDEAEFVEYDTGDWRCTYYSRASGLPIVGIFTEEFVSAEQTITSGGALSLTHSLNSTPKLIVCFLKCTTAEHNYSIGDEPLITPTIFSAGNNFQITDLNSSTIEIRYGNAANGMILANKTTGAGTQMTSTSWRLIVKGYA